MSKDSRSVIAAQDNTFIVPITPEQISVRDAKRYAEWLHRTGQDQQVSPASISYTPQSQDMMGSAYWNGVRNRIKGGLDFLYDLTHSYDGIPLVGGEAFAKSTRLDQLLNYKNGIPLFDTNAVEIGSNPIPALYGRTVKPLITSHKPALRLYSKSSDKLSDYIKLYQPESKVTKVSSPEGIRYTSTNGNTVAFVPKNGRITDTPIPANHLHFKPKLSSGEKELPPDFINTVATLKQTPFSETVPEFRPSFSGSNPYIVNYRQYLTTLGYDHTRLSDDDIARVLTENYNLLNNTSNGSMKGQVVWRTDRAYPSFKQPAFDFDADVLNFKGHLGQETHNTGFYGSGNYFSTGADGIADGAHINQPFMLTGVNETILTTGDLNKTGDYIRKLVEQDPNLIAGALGRQYGWVDQIGAKGREFVIGRDIGIKALYPHPDTANGTSFVRNWSNPRIHYGIWPIVIPIGIGTGLNLKQHESK